MEIMTYLKIISENKNYQRKPWSIDVQCKKSLAEALGWIRHSMDWRNFPSVEPEAIEYSTYFSKRVINAP